MWTPPQDLDVIYVQRTWKHCARIFRWGNIHEKGTNTVEFLTHDKIKAIPAELTVNYTRIVVDYREKKYDTHCVRLTVGGDLIDYPSEFTNRTSDLTTNNICWNSFISTEGGRYICADINSFYLETLIDRPEYICMPLKLIPEKFQEAYDLKSRSKNV